MLSLLNVGISTAAMQEKDQKLEAADKEQNFLGVEASKILPNEIWAIILEFLYRDQGIVRESQDIHEALTIVNTRLPLIFKNLRLTCKSFDEDFYLSQRKLKIFYQNILKNRFLEYRDGGFYPINSEWGLDQKTNSEIAQFMSTKITSNECILINLVQFRRSKRSDQIIISKNNQDIISKLVNLVLFYGANVNIQDNHGNAVLMNSIYCHGSDNNLKDIIVMLLTHGVNINDKDISGETVLQPAIRFGSNENNFKDIIKMLLIYGVNVNNQDNENKIALHIAISYYKTDHNSKDIIILLLVYGADVNIKNNLGQTALMIAQEMNFEGFDKLVKFYFPQGTLKNLYLRSVLTRN